MRNFTVALDVDALDDLAAIRAHITQASGSIIADRFVRRVFDYVDGFRAAPFRGTLREDIRPGLRTVAWRRTLTIAFVVDEASDAVIVLAALYRGRDVEAVLKRRTTT